MRITAAVVEELDGPFTIPPLELDEPGPGEVLVRLAATGICHTDGLARHGDLPFPLPGVLVPRFPFDRLVEYFSLADVQTALDKSYAGEVVKPIVRMP
jgi:Zn-dependent alcohol dehydrogenase